MYQISCRDLGLTGCDHVESAHSLRKLERHVLDHARDEHPELIRGITEEEHEALIRRIAECATQVDAA